jgi:putative MFS transporter
MSDRERNTGATSGIAYAHPRLFGVGVAAVTAGVLLHLPMYVDSASAGYRMAGMPMDQEMRAGMALIVAGFGLAVYGLLPRRGQIVSATDRVRVETLDDAPINRAHVLLLVVLALAVTIDVMKPVTLGFVAPGVAREYGLRSPANPGGHTPVALLPLMGITGTMIGSVLWGWLGDRIGRRASILLAGIVFVGTAICGAMPSFGWNLAMCFVMGLGVGGMLPITFALIAETVPARHRSWLMVLLGGDVAGGYLLTSWLSAELTPTYGWRILWLIGLPTGLLLLALNRWIPESPRFLVEHGRHAEASALLRRYGARVTTESLSGPAARGPGGFRDLGRPGLLGPTVVVLLFAVAVGLVTFGFQLWIPSNLTALGFTEVTSDRILRDSALIGFPLTLLVAWLYGFWSSRGTLLLLGVLTTGALLGFVVAGDSVAHHRTLLYALLVIPTTGISSVLAAIVAYGAEVYPTTLRSRGAGLAAGASKLGGVTVIALVAVAASTPSIATIAWIGAVPMALAAVAVALLGVETRQRRLEEILTTRAPEVTT